MRPLSALLVVAVCLLAGCAPAAPARRDVVIGLVGEPPAILADHPSARVLAAAVTESLVVRDHTAQFAPRLAESVPTFENGLLTVSYEEPDAPGGRLVATFRIRAAARWHDGKEITGDDVRFAWDEDRQAAPGSEARLIAERVERVEIVAEKIVRVVYRANERWEGYPLAARVMPSHLLAGMTANARAAFARDPVHAGPFVVAAWLPGYGVTLAAYPDYVLGRPGLGRIEVRFFSDRNAALAALTRSEIDIAPSPVLEADLVRVLDRLADGTERARLLTYYTAAEAIETLRFGGRFADLNVRRAVELSVDRPAIVEAVFAGRARVTRSYLVPPVAGAIDLGAPPRPDREQARSLLAQSRYVAGNFGILQRGDERLILTIVIAEGSVARAEAAQIVAGQLAAVGIAANVRPLPLREVEILIATGAYDLAVVPELASDAQLATGRYVGHVGPWFDVLAGAARGAPDSGEGRLLYGELQRVHLETVASLPLYQYLSVDVAPRSLGGIRPTPHLAPLTWNAWEWRFATP